MLAIIKRLQSIQSNTVTFNLLVGKNDRNALKEFLAKKGVIVTNDSHHSDYLTCEATKTSFEILFQCKLHWKQLVVGGWEVSSGNLVSVKKYNIKEVLLYKNLMLPRRFITKTTIK